MRLSDSIASFIKAMLEEGPDTVDLQRNDLAEYFGCAPSQINYVLATRFTPEHGYLTESKRGGGGYIRIVRVVETGPLQLLESIGDSLTELDAIRLIAQMTERGMVTRGEAEIMLAGLTGQALALPLSPLAKDVLRAQLMKSMLLAVAKNNQSHT